MADWRRSLTRALRIGLVAGAGVIYLTAVGIVLAFADRDTITDIVTLGRVMLAAPPIVAGYLAADRGSIALRLACGLLAGAVGGVLLAAGLLFASAVDIRDMFVRVSSNLLDFVAFEQEPTIGAALNVALTTALGLAGSVIRLVPPIVRRPVVAGLLAIVVMSMLEPFLRPRLNEFDLRAVSGFLYKGRGVSTPGAVLVFAIASAVILGWRPARRELRQRYARSDAQLQGMIRWALALVGIAFLLALPQLAGPLLSQVLVFVGLYILLALGLNIVVGYAGLLDLGYVAFYAVGSYLTALLTATGSALGLELPFFVALPIVIVGAAVTGLLIGAPVLRLRGDYLAIVTLGFGEIARLLFLSDALRPWFGGTQGIIGIPDMFGVPRITVPVLGWNLGGPTLTYYPLLVFCIVAAFVATRLKYSRVGRAWNAMREDEDVAEATGVNTVNYKLLAFALGASVGCLGGAIFATHLESVFPGTFSVLVSITVLAIVILGGMGSIPGVIVGAIVLIGLPELLREFAEFRLLVYGAVLVVMMLVRPEGLVPDVARSRELHEEESGTLTVAGTGTPVGGT